METAVLEKPQTLIGHDKKIQFHFSLFDEANKKFAVEKADTAGTQHRYLCGVMTGMNPDAHKEKLTPHAIQSITSQANSGDILLYADIHGLRASEDIGILSGFKVLENGDWYAEFRLYDESDGVDQRSIDTANKLWLQVNGMPPYTRPRQKGFSIEGFIPGNSGLIRRESEGVIDDVVIEGVIVVPRPAYKDSVIHAVYKALGETPPWEYRNRFRSGMREVISDKIEQEEYWSRRFELEGVRDDLIAEIMTTNPPEPEEKLRMVFEEYSDLMVELILSSPSVFTAVEKDVASPYENIPQSTGVETLLKLKEQLEELVRGLTGEPNEDINS